MSKFANPPYSKQLSDFLKNCGTVTNDIFIFFGAQSAWAKAANFWRSGKIALVLPVDDDPLKYRWQIIKDLPVLCFDLSLYGIGIETIRKLAWLLLSAGATIVRMASPSLMGNFAIYRQEVGYGRE